VIRHAAALVATGTAGFLVAGARGAALAMAACAGALVAYRRVRTRKAQAAERPPPSVYANIDEVMERLHDVARERNWNLGKRFEIARMACEDRKMAIDELERRYDRGLRSFPDRNRQDASERPKPIEGMKYEIAILFVVCVLYILLILSCSFSYP
jgi:hypothetical protein